MKKDQFIRICVFAAGIFVAISASAWAQEKEAPDAGDYSLSNSPMTNGALMYGEGYSGISRDAGDFMETYAFPISHGDSPFLAPVFFSKTSVFTTPAASMSHMPLSPTLFSIQNLPQVLQIPISASASASESAVAPLGSAASLEGQQLPTGSPPPPSGSLEDFLSNAQSGQTQGLDSSLHAQDEDSVSAGNNTTSKSLLKNLLAPLALPAGKAGTASAGQAAQMGREDYESHILGYSGQKSGGSAQSQNTPWATRPTLRALPQPEASNPLPGASSNQVMVALSLDIKNNSGEFRDALADLSKATSFRPEPGFATGVPGPAMNGQVAVIGWLPKNKVTKLFQVPSVRRVRVDWNPGPSSAQSLLSFPGASSRMIMGLRIPAGTDPAQALQVDLPRLLEESGFSYEHTIGYRTIHGSKDTMIMVSGSIPVRELFAALGDPAVVRLAPVPVPPPPGATPRQQAGLFGFFPYVMTRSPGLFGLTALAVVFSLAGF